MHAYTELGNFMNCCKHCTFLSTIHTTHSGHGSCINSRCECDEEFTGGACDCMRDTSTCVRPGDEGSSSSTLCSGQGDCVCGVCVCNDYGVSFGQYCEECVVSEKCYTLSSVVAISDYQILWLLAKFFPLIVSLSLSAMSYIMFQGVWMCEVQCTWQLWSV